MSTNPYTSFGGSTFSGALPAPEPKKTENAIATRTPAEVPTGPVSLYQIFAQMVRDPSIDPARIAKFMELHERAEEREAERQFITALNRLQPRLPRIEKNGRANIESKRTGQKYGYAWARFEDIDTEIRPLLIEEGFSISFGTVLAERGGILITATLSHVAGHSRTESMPLPFDEGNGKNSLQAVGSTFSYGKRYLLCAMLNIVTVDEDDDGAGGGALPSKTINAEQISNIRQMYERCKMSADSQAGFLRFMQVQRVEDILQSQYGRAMTQLQAKFREVMRKQPGSESAQSGKAVAR